MAEWADAKEEHALAFNLSNGTTIVLGLYIGVDGTPVAFVDTPDIDEDADGPKIRIWLNDDTVYENPEVWTV